MERTLAFDNNYREDITLSSGLRVRLKLIQPEDKRRLQEGLARMSSESRYLRFFTDKPRLTKGELAYLTELDQDSHFAIGAVEVDDNGEDGEGLGVARFIRLPEDERLAEPAIAVVDRAQGQGLGGLLMDRLSDAARERDVQAFRSEFLAWNDGARELFKSMSDVVSFSADGTVAVAELPLTRQLPAVLSGGEPGPAHRDRMDDLFRLAASRMLRVRRRFATLLHGDDVWGTLKKLAEEFAEEFSGKPGR
ncbi:MAG: GNAT family N-acetyltransferase [Nannocystaceae bacterium]|nr:GNAT family N-acetyltransferase [Nannocystaceae bacterium]